MKPQDNAEIIENPIHTIWVDESGILCFIAKQHPAQTVEESKQLFEDIRKISKEEKLCWLMGITNFQIPTKAARDYGESEIQKMTKAIAFLSDSMLGKYVVNILLTLKPQPFPTKMFTDARKAREWLKQYL